MIFKYQYLLFLKSKEKEALKNNRIVLFSYGSGLAASMFSLIVANTADTQLDLIIKSLQMQREELENARFEVEPNVYHKYLDIREQSNKIVPRQIIFGPDTLRHGTWYLVSIDEKYRRKYERVPLKKAIDLTKATSLIKQKLFQLS